METQRIKNQKIINNPFVSSINYDSTILFISVIKRSAKLNIPDIEALGISYLI